MGTIRATDWDDIFRAIILMWRLIIRRAFSSALGAIWISRSSVSYDDALAPSRIRRSHSLWTNFILSASHSIHLSMRRMNHFWLKWCSVSPLSHFMSCIISPLAAHTIIFILLSAASFNIIVWAFCWPSIALLIFLLFISYMSRAITWPMAIIVHFRIAAMASTICRKPLALSAVLIIILMPPTAVLNIFHFGLLHLSGHASQGIRYSSTKYGLWAGYRRFGRHRGDCDECSHLSTDS